MKIVELRRHTDNEGDRLSPEGIAAAREVGARLSPPYHAFISTGAGRATETLEVWRSAVKGTALVEDEPDLRSQDEDRWRDLYRTAGSGSLEQLRTADPAFVREQAERLGAALGRVFERLPAGGRALVCGHSPTNEAAVLGLTGEIVGPMAKGAGVRVVLTDEGGYRVEPLP